MTRKQGDKPFTELERQAITAQIADYLLFNMSEHEMFIALEKRFKRQISYGMIGKLRCEILKKQGTADEWLDYHARTELAEFYRQRIDELQYVQKNLFQILDEEKAKGDKMNVYKYNLIAKTVIENSKVLAEFGLAPPVLAKIKEMLPIDITDLNNRVQERKAIADKVRREDINEEDVIDVSEQQEEEDIDINELETIRNQTKNAKTGIFFSGDNENNRSTSGESEDSTDDSQRVF